MQPVQLILVAIVAALVLLATHRWAKQQRADLENLVPPPSLDSVGTWEEEVLAAQLAADSSPEPDASEPDASEPDASEGADTTPLR